MMRTRIRDVAEHAGVSLQTVSNVVNGSGRVGDETRARVLSSIEALGYRPNAVARSLRGGRVGIIALAIPDLVNPYYSEIGDAVVAEAAAHAYTVLLDNTRFERTSESLVAGGLRLHAIDGVILEPHSLGLADLDQRRVAIPIVLLGENLWDAPHDRVAVDNVAAARMATQHLITLGRRHIAVIGIDRQKAAGAAVLRRQGFLDAMEEAGCAVEPRLLASGGNWHRADGAHAMRSLMALDHPPDAVFCFNDLLALGAMSATQAAGWHIPDDLAVVGYDGIEEGRFATPSLTTVAADKVAIGRLAVSVLLDRISGRRTGPPEWIKPSFDLLVRNSTVANRAGSMGRRRADSSPAQALRADRD
jgi:DNA-binding LacI/PurR family transcriptional regulator